MEIFRVAKKSLYDKTDGKLQRIAGTIGAVLAIMGALSGAYSWASAQLTNVISAQISDFRQEVTTANTRQDQAITRLELTNLMQTDPTNVVAIEKMARYYFGKLDGDLYMTQKYSDWCKKYGGDATIVIGGK